MKRLPLITNIVICLSALVTLVVGIRACCRQREAAPPAPPAQPEPAPVLSAVERNLDKVQERLADKEYMATLHDLARTQASLASARARAQGAFAEWYDGWSISNEAARALLEKASRPSTGTNELAAIKGELKALVLADPEGAALRARIDEAEAAVSNHQNVVKGVIGARLRQQTEEHAGEELAAEKILREAWLKEHPEAVATPAPSRPAMSSTNLLAKRETIWSNGVKIVRATFAPVSTNVPPREDPVSSGPRAGVPPSPPPQPATQNPQPETRNQKLGTQNQEPEKTP